MELSFLSQVGLVDVLSAMGVSPHGIVGHSVGELGCGYADGSLTARETILAAYWRGRCIVEAQLEPGAMAAVGKITPDVLFFIKNFFMVINNNICQPS